MDFSILGIITIFILFTSLLLALFVLTVKTANKKANTFLGLYFLVFALHISVFFYHKYITLPLTLEMLRDHIAYFTSPLLFLYIVSSIYSDFKLTSNHLLHIIPFVTIILVFVPRFYLADNFTKLELMNNINKTFEGRISTYFSLFLQPFYLTLSFLELRKYKQLLLENYSDKSAFNYKWLYQLLVLLSTIYCFSLVKQIYWLYGTDVEILTILRVIITLVLLVFLTWIVLKSMYYPDLFRNINSEHLLVKDILEEKEINNKPSKNEEKIYQLLAFMKKEEPFLDASLTLQKLADKIGLPHRDVSILINSNLNQHFFDFINQFRIDKAKEILQSSNGKKLTIQQIMYDVGFSSKSSFYTVFKKQTGLTPSEYRKNKDSI